MFNSHFGLFNFSDIFELSQHWVLPAPPALPTPQFSIVSPLPFESPYNHSETLSTNAGHQINNKSIGQLYNIKPNAVYMRLTRLGKVIEARAGPQGGNDVEKGQGNDLATAAPAMTIRAKGSGVSAGAGKGKKRKAEEEENTTYKDAKDEKHTQSKPGAKKPKLSPPSSPSSSTGVKIEGGDEESNGLYSGGGTADDDGADGIA